MYTDNTVLYRVACIEERWRRVIKLPFKKYPIEKKCCFTNKYSFGKKNIGKNVSSKFIEKFA